MWRFAFIAVLIAHGLVHIAVWAPKYQKGKVPFDASQSWLFGQARPFAVGLAVVSAVLLVLAGLGLWAHAGWWRPLTVLGLGFSLSVLVLYFNPWYVFITGGNIALIAGIVWFSWPSKSMLGA
jgi:hypothetical protein